ncbi:unnamed protein product [Adineta ricciae]|uniref:H/ACA ribonucleoprotein complex non-core subunit NAF1 n=1 Tax=Adineta ricciae TaxID=249248 RepID=A0A814JQH3_ADIRI|nr:unnamed protein product [Adineta ricciae]CAF1038770.1 unnamed protein product [Adineta ricciae]
MESTDSADSVDNQVKTLLNELLDRAQFINSLSENISVKLEPRHHKKLPRQSKQKKRRIFSSSEDDSSSSSDESCLSDDKNTLINQDSDSDTDEQKALRNRQGVRTRNELSVEDLPPIENLTITLSEETPIERIGYIRHIIDGKLVIIESLLHSPALNDDSVLFNRDRRSIGLVFETFGPVEKPCYSIRYNDIDSIHQRQIELNQEVFYAPKETTYTKYVFVQELRALKGSDASWEDDNEPPKFALDYSDDEQERIAKAVLKGKRSLDDNTDESIADVVSPPLTTTINHPNVFSPNFSNLQRGRGRGQQRGFRRGGNNADNRPAPNIPNWFQNTSNASSFQSRPAALPQAFWQNSTSAASNSNPFTFSNVISSNSNNANDQSTQQSSFQGNFSTHSAFPWM